VLFAEGFFCAAGDWSDEPAEARGMKRRAWSARLRRWALTLVLGFIGVSIMLVMLFRWVDPPYSAVMLQRAITEGAAQEHRWVPFELIDPQFALAVLAAEDQRFPEHWGFDTTQIVAAVEDRLDGLPLRGASTITQQVARNLYLWQGRSYLRKGLEVWFTLLLEVFWPKERILEVYLNIAETGKRSFGVGVAAQRYFGRSAADLGARRAALLAAVLPNPVRYRVEAPSAYVRQRQEWILGQMRNLGGVSYLGRLTTPG
jgi:monofunctional biosynthetic peptidoglycan transglycosylase